VNTAGQNETELFLVVCLFVRSILSVLFYHYRAFGEIKIYIPTSWNYMNIGCSKQFRECTFKYLRFLSYRMPMTELMLLFLLLQPTSVVNASTAVRRRRLCGDVTGPDSISATRVVSIKR